jgi:dTDP-4-amino-4,6-dideoxygalactose transaminase
MRMAIDEVTDSQQFILGPVVKRFEEQMAQDLQCGFAIGVASGSDALWLALMTLGVGPDDGVIVTPFTFFFHSLSEHSSRREAAIRRHRQR